MVVDAVRTYLDAANGLTELSRKQAVAAAKTLLRANGAGGPALPGAGEGDTPPPRVGQSIQALAGELIETSQANRSALADLVRAEVGRQLERMDVVPRGEHERLVRRVAELERRLAARHAVERALAPEAAGAASPVAPAAGPAGQDADADTGAARGPAAPPETEGAAGGGAPEVREAPGGDGSEGSSDAAADDRDGAGDPAGEGEEAAPAEAGAAGTKARTRAPAKTARARSTAKRTPKGKGPAKK
ncbi:membrane fusogenic activity family protein [Nocardiopsis tropica]|uniref:Membrane fusogenic activity family protein n=1 Tax=Nocardiopsis tropica TaxID=109330 RepID=A0ABU7KL18_9ACTN|nr:membrane fusogenic activity family protein [Nocardiopsis umidischolae]MEE2049956.1 membrane fusogenic activity family protein [Nocardiopsis umidischolae]